MKTKPSSNASISNIYKLDGQVPLGKAIPFGIQHILAMFVSNLTPLFLLERLQDWTKQKPHSYYKTLCLLQELPL